MNSIEVNMLNILKELRDENGVLAVRAEFEAEGSRTDELQLLTQIVYRADMKLYVKIGGCEAIRDIDQCYTLGAAGIMAPMIETPFAMQKFRSAAERVFAEKVTDIDWIINAETKTCCQYLDEILNEGEGFLKTVSVGRVDLSASMGLSRDQINQDIMFEATKTIAQKARKSKYNVNFGGGVSFDAIPFICAMKPYADRFETRKIIFNIDDNEKQLKKGLYNAMRFEMLYLKNKSAFYGRMANEDAARVKLMEERIERAKAKLDK